jgi:hypothetical protein
MTERQFPEATYPALNAQPQWIVTSSGIEARASTGS